MNFTIVVNISESIPIDNDPINSFFFGARGEEDREFVSARDRYSFFTLFSGATNILSQNKKRILFKNLFYFFETCILHKIKVILQYGRIAGVVWANRRVVPVYVVYVCEHQKNQQQMR